MHTSIPHGLIFSLQLGIGLFWTLTYILLIKRGFQDSTVGMPLLALCANISWEFVYAFVRPSPPPDQYINAAWFLLDGVVFIQALRFGAQDLPRGISKRFLPAVLLFGLFLGGGAVAAITFEFQGWGGRQYLAFGLNLMMSALFIVMLLQRDSVRGQSMYIALFKLLGTLLASIVSFLYFPDSKLLLFLYVAILTLDVPYAVMLHAKLREAGLSPWKRF